jgi:hypothetical protein
VKVKLLKISTDTLDDATIRDGKPNELPSIQSGWRFNFGSRKKELPYSTSYVLVSQETPDIIEGCLIFQMVDKTVPYMAYVEVAPHNRTEPKKYEYVGGCLIAFACKQSVTLGKNHNQGWLTFDVSEEDPIDQNRLMALYSSKYKAQRYMDTTTMWISPEDGRSLIEEYLER